MPVTLRVEAEDAAVKTQREILAQRVINYFGLCLPDSRLLCFLDDEDPPTLRGDHGPANRGLYMPIHDLGDLDGWPKDVRECIYPSNRYGSRSRVFDDLVYLYGSTCIDEVGLTMSLTHELQHVIQHAGNRRLWAANTLINDLKRETVSALGLTWADIPTEVEARIRSKCVAESLVGKQRVRKYINKRIGQRATEADVADWEFVRSLTTSSSVDLVAGTQLLFERLRECRSEIEVAFGRKEAMRISATWIWTSFSPRPGQRNDSGSAVRLKGRSALGGGAHLRLRRYQRPHPLTNQYPRDAAHGEYFSTGTRRRFIYSSLSRYSPGTSSWGTSWV